MTMSPLVSVVMPVYNAEVFVEDAIRSVLRQSYGNFELIIIDDRSTDRTYEILKGFQAVDPRIRLTRLPSNRGIISALNQGLKAAQGKYIARMDADDISLPQRFSKQVAYLEAHPEIGILGCGVQNIDHTGKLSFIPTLLSDPLQVRWYVFFGSPFYHPTVMIRKSLLDQFSLAYDPAHQHGEDYGLWARLLSHSQGDNLPEVLLYYRIHPESLTVKYYREQRQMAARISSAAIQAYLGQSTFPPGQVSDLSRAFLDNSREMKRQRSRLIHIYLQLWKEFSIRNHSHAGLPGLKRSALAWAARMILYPPFQEGSLRALWALSALDWRWPVYLLGQLPYYWARRQVR